MKPRAQRVARHQPDHQIVQIQVLPPQRHVRRQRAVQQRGDECNLGAGVARRLLERCGEPCAVSRRTEGLVTVRQAAEFAVGMCFVSPACAPAVVETHHVLPKLEAPKSTVFVDYAASRHS